MSPPCDPGGCLCCLPSPPSCGPGQPFDRGVREWVQQQLQVPQRGAVCSKQVHVCVLQQVQVAAADVGTRECAAAGAAVDVDAAAGASRRLGVAAGVVVGGRWPRMCGLACPEASSWMENSKDKCPCLSGAGSFDSTQRRSSEATNGAVKGSTFCCKTSLSCLFFWKLCLCTKKTTISICMLR